MGHSKTIFFLLALHNDAHGTRGILNSTAAWPTVAPCLADTRPTADHTERV